MRRSVTTLIRTIILLRLFMDGKVSGSKIKSHNVDQRTCCRTSCRCRKRRQKKSCHIFLRRNSVIYAVEICQRYVLVCISRDGSRLGKYCTNKTATTTHTNSHEVFTLQVSFASHWFYGFTLSAKINKIV